MQKGLSATPAPGATRWQMQRLIAGASLEISTPRDGDFDRLAALPLGTQVFVTHLPRRPLIETLPILHALHHIGLKPVPHIAARRIASRAEITEHLIEATRMANVQRVLLVGGDSAEPAGPYPDALSLLRDRVLPQGIEAVALAAYPQGHPRIDASALQVALDAKLSCAQEQGLKVSVVTQFGFDPKATVAWCESMARTHPKLPVHIGLPGPADAGQLLRYAQRCGVGASMRAITGQGLGGTLKLLLHVEPTAQIDAIANHLATAQALGHPSTVASVHVFSFGSIDRSIDWMARVG